MRKNQTFIRILLPVMAALTVFAGIVKYPFDREKTYCLRTGNPDGAISLLALAEESIKAPEQVSETSTEHEAFEIINRIREVAGLPAFEWSSRLYADATVRAEEAGSCFSHTRPDGSAWYTLDPAGMYGENLASVYREPEELVLAWFRAPGHLRNLLGPYETAAIACSESGQTRYWAMEFGFMEGR